MLSSGKLVDGETGRGRKRRLCQIPMLSATGTLVLAVEGENRTADPADGLSRVEVHIVPAGVAGECGGHPAQEEPRLAGQSVRDALGGFTER